MKTMRWLVAGLAMLAMIAGTRLSAADDDDAPKGKVVTNKKGKFSVWMPKEVKETSQEVPLADAKLKIYLTTAEVSDELAYLVSYNDYPFEIDADDAQKMLAKVRDGNAETFKGKIIRDKEGTFQKKPCRDIRIEATVGGKDLVYRSKIILDGSRLYQVILIGDEDTVNGDDAKKYYQSFKITE